MATAQVQLTPNTDTIPVSVNIEKELSGPQWVTRYPGSNQIADLIEPFRSNLSRFKSAMEAAGVGVHVTVTYRPEPRAYLMHYCVLVANGSISPSNVPELAGVYIEWDHEDLEKSKRAARQMANNYGIVYPAAYPTRHTSRLAVDMTLTHFMNKTVINALGVGVEIKIESDLYPVGATFNVLKLIPDHPHWSDNGH